MERQNLSFYPIFIFKKPSITIIIIIVRTIYYTDFLQFLTVFKYVRVLIITFITFVNINVNY